MKNIGILSISILVILVGVQSTFGNSTATKPAAKFFSQQWALFNDGTQTVSIATDDSHTVSQKGTAGADIGWLEAKDDMNRRAKSPVLVAVIDSGVDYNHPDLVGRIADGGWDFLTQSPLKGDYTGHGTQTIGIIAANADNPDGIAGIAPSTVKILPLAMMANCSIQSNKCYKNFQYNGKLVSDYTADAVRYAVDHHADIINLSLAWPGLVDTQKARDAFQYAVDKGVIVIAAAGNDRKIHTPYPCGYPGIICVGAVTNTGDMSLYSNYGGLVDILAPGDDIISTFPTDQESQQLRVRGYDLGSGTSASSPHVAGVAAAIKSVYPTISPDEIKARILGSANSLNQKEKSLYGIINLKRALDPTPPTVFWPQFRTLGTITIEEKDLSIRGSLAVKVLPAKSVSFSAQIMINGENAGQMKGHPKDGVISIPWTYQFKSLDGAGDLSFKVQITDESGNIQTFNYETLASRKMKELSGNINYTVKNTFSGDWIGTNSIGHYYSKLSTVDNIFSPWEAPIYYRQSAADKNTNSSTLQIFDTSKNGATTSRIIPGIQKISEVIKADILGDGQPDLVVTGIGNNGQGNYFEFYFLNSLGQLLGGTTSESVWQISLNSQFYQNILVNYSGGASWIPWMDPVLRTTRLIPASFSAGRLPDKDNFNALTLRHYAIDRHLYYMAPISTPTDQTQPTQLEIRAVDNADFRNPYEELHFVNLIRPTQNKPQQGHVQMVAQLGHDLSAPIKIFDVPSFDKPTLVPSNWEAISISNVSNGALTGQGSVNGTAFYRINKSSGSVAWSSSDGSFKGRSDFSYSAPLSQLVGFLGAFNFPGANYIFAESNFDVLGFSYPNGSTGPSVMQKLPIERDSSMPEDQFNQLFAQITVGSANHPLPGLYVDSTWVQGDQVSVMVWDTDNNQMLKPLRYSLQVPSGCVEMMPSYTSNKVESLVVPIICQDSSGSGQPSITLVKPTGN